MGQLHRMDLDDPEIRTQAEDVVQWVQASSSFFCAMHRSCKPRPEPLSCTCDAALLLRALDPIRCLGETTTLHARKSDAP